MHTHEWDLKRNCSLSPRQLGAAYGVLLAISMFISMTVTIKYGAWQVLAFSLLEMTGVGVAFAVYGRHATDREHVSLTQDQLLIRRHLGSKVQQLNLDARYAKVVAPKNYTDLIVVEGQGTQFQIGRFINAKTRKMVAWELRQELQRQRTFNPFP